MVMTASMNACLGDLMTKNCQLGRLVTLSLGITGLRGHNGDAGYDWLPDWATRGVCRRCHRFVRLQCHHGDDGCDEATVWAT